MAMMTMLPRSTSQFRGRRHASITRLDYTSCRRHSHVVRRRTTITTNSSIATLVVGASGDDDSLLEPFELVGKRIELAGDELTISQICAAFAAAQGIPRVKQLRLPMWLLRILNGELYNISAFYRDEGYHANIEANEEMFGIRLLTFPEFLARTHWSDTSVSYETMRYHDVTTNNNDDDDDEESEEEF